uniref:Uncharacterized protein n=1 Tax=Myoviridae sp. ctshb19 TaxID=2825194 RepID=A0A8S5UGS9_9CAUD|nr:MAG TPA: hypothetical protein [Myoviridae sp. ctshb19]
MFYLFMSQHLSPHRFPRLRGLFFAQNFCLP